MYYVLHIIFSNPFSFPVNVIVTFGVFTLLSEKLRQLSKASHLYETAQVPLELIAHMALN